MKKVLIVFMVAFIATGALFAGGSGGSSSGGDDSVTLSLYYYHDLTDPIADGQRQEILDTWMEKYPNIELEIENQFNEPFHQKLQAMAVSKQLPEVLYLWPGKRTGYVTGAGLAKDLRPWLGNKSSEFAPAAMTPQGPNGEMWELPQQVTATHVVYANTKILDELGLDYPTSVDEWISQKAKIEAAGYLPIAMDNGDGWQMQSCFLSALTERGGGMDWYNDVLVGDASWSDPEFVNAVSVIKNLSDAEMFSPGINTAAYGEALSAFANGEAAYLIDGGWRVNNMVESVPDDLKPYIELKTSPDIPMQKGTSDSTAVVAGTGWGMSADIADEKADAAWEWIWYFSGPEGSQIRVGHGMIPAYVDVDYGEQDVLLAKLVEFLNTKPAGYVIDAVVDGEGMSVLHPALQEMMFGNKTPQQVADEFEAWVAANDSTRKANM